MERLTEDVTQVLDLDDAHLDAARDPLAPPQLGAAVFRPAR